MYVRNSARHTRSHEFSLLCYNEGTQQWHSNSGHFHVLGSWCKSFKYRNMAFVVVSDSHQKERKDGFKSKRERDLVQKELCSLEVGER